jgi:3'-phosphoadenosine 5'-phosphosulfate sulfotransferase (PAPS reductase)/FAD synthetase
MKPSEGSGRWTFWKIVEKYGWPIGQRRGATATGKCCYRLKKAPMKKAIKKYGFDLVIDGMTIFESRQRHLQLRKHIPTRGYRYNKTWDTMKLSPILDWAPVDVWEYIKMRDLPYNSYYDNEMPGIPGLTKRGYIEKGFHRSLRVGCWACTIPLKYDPAYLMHMRKFYPKLHEILLKKGLAQHLLDNSDDLELYRVFSADWMIENRICEFEGITVEA